MRTTGSPREAMALWGEVGGDSSTDRAEPATRARVAATMKQDEEEKEEKSEIEIKDQFLGT